MKLFSMTLLAGMALTSCGHKSSDGGATPNPEVNPPSVPPTPEVKPEENGPTKQELLTLASVSAADSQAGRNRCTDILSSGAFNKSRQRMSQNSVDALKRHFCSLSDEDVTIKLRALAQSKRSSSSSSSSDQGIGLEYVDIGLDFSNSEEGTRAQSEEMTQQNAQDYVKKWRTKTCKSSDAYSSQDLAQAIESDVADQGIVQAWRDCVTQVQSGFFCEMKKIGSVGSLKMKWEPNPVQQRLLPKLTLKWNTEFNVSRLGAELPRELGAGSGVEIGFKLADAAKIGLIQVSGGDKDATVSYSCSAELAPTWSRRAECGVEKYITDRRAECGAEFYKLSRGEVCGVERYRNLPNLACGIATYKMGNGPVCGESGVTKDYSEPVFSLPKMPLLTQRHLENIMRGKEDNGELKALCSKHGKRYISWNVYDEGNAWQGYVNCGTTTFHNCRHVAFGPETFQSCEHSNNGPELFRECRHEKFGAEQYKECTHESFGVASYKSCVELQ